MMVLISAVSLWRNNRPCFTANVLTFFVVGECQCDGDNIIDGSVQFSQRSLCNTAEKTIGTQSSLIPQFNSCVFSTVTCQHVCN